MAPHPIPIVRVHTGGSAKLNRWGYAVYVYSMRIQRKDSDLVWPNHVRFQRRAPEPQDPSEGINSSRAVEW